MKHSCGHFVRLAKILIVVVSMDGVVGCSKKSNSGTVSPASLNMEASFSQGTKKITGTLNFGSTVAQGNTIILAYSEGVPLSNWVANEMKSFTLSSEGSSVKFQISGLGSRTYTVWARVDYNQNGQMDAGDIGGYYVLDTTLAPTYQNATLIDLTTLESTDVSVSMQAVQ